MAQYEFYNKQGRLTMYALACGYIELFDRDGYRASIWREGSTLHVRATNFHKGEQLFWECPATLTQARKMFDKATRLFVALINKGETN